MENSFTISMVVRFRDLNVIMYVNNAVYTSYLVVRQS